MDFLVSAMALLIGRDEVTGYADAHVWEAWIKRDVVEQMERMNCTAFIEQIDSLKHKK